MVGNLIRALLTLVVVLAIGAAAAWFYGQRLYLQPGPVTPDGAPRLVVIPQGATGAAIGSRLEAAGAVRNADLFGLALQVRSLLAPKSGDPFVLKAAEYAIPSGASIKEVQDLLAGGRGVLYTVVIPEGLTSARIAKLLAEEDWKAAGGVLAFMQLAGNPPTSIPEGSLLPGDYMAARGDTIASIVERARIAQVELLAQLWPKRLGVGLPLATPEEAIILASIVENETGIAEERPLVASLFINRLRKGMRLQSDPTIVYGLTGGTPLGHGLRRSEIAKKTDWNTYQIDGLPRTAICHPGRASIEAVLNPPESDYLFFVADGSGGHAFSRTLAEHERNVKAWRAIESARASPAAVERR